MTPDRYQNVYPTEPLLDSARLVRRSAAELLTLEYFEADAASMPERVFAQHHILLNYRLEPLRVENWRDGVYRDFTYHKDEIIVTPAGVKSGWRWHVQSKVIVITLDPDKLERFALNELGIALTREQIQDLPQFTDPDICQAGWQLKEALALPALGSDVVFESLARVFLVKLLGKYGKRHAVEAEADGGLSAKRYSRVLEHISANFADTVTLEDLADVAGLSPSHFSRQFKRTIGQSPMQYVSAYRVEQAKKGLAEPDRPLIDIALGCGFADQAHFSRVFKQFQQETPKAYRKRTRAGTAATTSEAA